MSSPVPARPPFPQASPIGRRSALAAGLALPLGVLIAGCSSETPHNARHPARRTPSTEPRRPPRSARLTLPAPTGHLEVGTVSLHLVDTSRPDPWVPSERVRQLMIQIWYPADQAGRYPRALYTTPATWRFQEEQEKAAVGIPVRLGQPITNGHVGAPVRRLAGGWPFVLYSPGLGGERFETTCIVEELVSHGYVVVTIDHIHDSAAVQLPDGQLEYSAVPRPTPRVVAKEIGSRVADVRFVLDQLAVINRGGNPDHERKPLPAGLRGALDLSRAGMFGRSDGGSTTAAAMQSDDRIIAGIDLDGTLWTPQAIDGSGHALLLFGRQDLDSYEAKTWAEFWARQRGPKLALNLQGSLHATFTDFAILDAQGARMIGAPRSVVVRSVGTINGERAVRVERTYVRAWFDKYLRGRDSSLLAGPSARYPEVRFRLIRSPGPKGVEAGSATERVMIDNSP